MELMASKPDKYFDLCVCDPPYGIDRNGMQMGNSIFNKDCKKWDNQAPQTLYFDLLNQKCKKYIIWGANHFIDNIPFNISSPCWLIWDKGETMYGRDFAECELALTNFKTPAKMFKMSPNQLTRIHPTQKPIALYDWIFANYLPNGGKVLDTHGGSMSSLISSIKRGNIEMEICELDKDYYNAAKKRVTEFTKQLNLFQPQPTIIWNDTQISVI
jgi:site-specific DNA-methyltransferase (adenine-specific)